ncbi:hypothetical protein MKW98_003941 [Papaver atlanticum]|uniref:Uncharacterized protein n=1 Tax=Papaver atlanticum TaxID=357466 RepID=A0AAD4XFX7_9MAGN|nr:hypothetical protein MKW98_003941 [Papaver atlanticum]
MQYPQNSAFMASFVASDTQFYGSAPQQHSFNRSVAMVLALVSSVVLSPLYIKRKTDIRNYETKWSSGYILPMVLVGLIAAIKTVSSSSPPSMQTGRGGAGASMDSSSVLKIGGSSWGLAGILLMLFLVLSWQDSVQHFLWR